MRKLGFVGALVWFLVVPASAQTSENASTAKPDYSKEAAVIEQHTYKIRFENDGTSVGEDSARVRLQSDAGVQHYGLLAFSYASGVGSFEVEYIRVHKPDGTLVETPAANIQDMPAEITRQAPFYSDIREKHVAVKGLGVGDLLEYKTETRVTKPLAPGHFWFDYGFPRDTIVLQEQLEVSVPRARSVKYASPELQPATGEAGEYRIYTWSTSNLAYRDKNEALDGAKLNWEQARGRFPQPDVALTSFQSWDEVGHWYRDLQADRVKLSPDILAKVAELTKGADSDDAKLRAIYNYVSLQFRYIGVAFGVGRFQPHSASDVLANQYGDCKDKHTLLAAMLDAAGIKAYAALINSEHETNPELPSPSQFNHMITAVDRGGQLLWLDSTAEVGPFQFLASPLRDKPALVIWDDRPASLLRTPADLPFPSFERFRMDAKLDDSGTLHGNADLSLRGDLEYGLRAAFRTTPMPQWKDIVQRISMSLGFAGEVSDVSASPPEKTDEPFQITYKYLRKDFGDWSNRRILAPSPFMVLPSINDDFSNLPVPFWLGEPIEITFHSQLEIPRGYSLEAPAAVHKKLDFAELDITHSFKNGTLTSDRRLRTLLRELPKKDFSAYQKLYKTVQDDYGSFIQLASDRAPDSNPEAAQATMFLNSVRALPDSSNQEALRLEAEGRQSLAQQDFQSAISSLYRAVGADPKFVRGWVMLGGLLMAVHQNDSGIDAFQKAVAIDPPEPAAQKIYALSLVSSHKLAESVPVWQSYIKLAPDDADGPTYLGAALMDLHRYDEAVPVFESAVRLDPNRAKSQINLGTAYLRTGAPQKADASFRKALELDPRPDALNRAAYAMAESDKTPPVARDFALQAVDALEKASTEIDSASHPVDEVDQAVRLAAYWGTLGWVQLRLGNLDDAEKTLAAAWKLTQNGVAAAHLCQLYLDEHKTQSAMHMCQLARSRLPMEKEPFLYGVPELIEQNDARIRTLNATAQSKNMSALDEIIAMRDLKVARVMSGTATAQFRLLIAFDAQARAFKVQDVQYLSGSDKLKLASKALLNLNFGFTSPDGNPVRVLRWGTFICGPGGCEFMLPDATAARSTPMPIRSVH